MRPTTAKTTTRNAETDRRLNRTVLGVGVTSALGDFSCETSHVILAVGVFGIGDFAHTPLIPAGVRIAVRDAL